MHILIAPNAFKNSLTAGEVSLAVQKGLESSNLSCTTECFPVGDGGDGTAQLIINKFKGTSVEVEVQDPLARTVKASFGLINDMQTAVIESANASGIRLLKDIDLDPFNASTIGTGEMILAAMDRGVSNIIICLGGSATVDGGAGMLTALGVKFIGDAGQLLLPNPQALSNLAGIDISGIDPRISACHITVLCDVDTYLLGENGAAAVFGPQKGVKEADVPKLDKILRTISEHASKETGKLMDKVKHGGAAGGLAAALYAFCNAELVAGAQNFLELTDFQTSMQECDLVITGEGNLDEQTLQGKAPHAVSLMARKLGIPVVGIAGQVPLESHAELNWHFDVLQCIGHEPSDLRHAIENTEANLIRTGNLLGNLISLRKNK